MKETAHTPPGRLFSSYFACWSVGTSSVHRTTTRDENIRWRGHAFPENLNNGTYS